MENTATGVGPLTASDILNAPDSESLATVADVARFLRKSRSWVYQHHTELPHLRIGSALRFEMGEVRAWALRQRSRELEGAAAEVVRLSDRPS
jgi:hypothetical protein